MDTFESALDGTYSPTKRRELDKQNVTVATEYEASQRQISAAINR